MSEAVLENEICQKCGAEVREGTTFCYKCGQKIENAATEIILTPATSNGSERTVDDADRAIEKTDDPIEPAAEDKEATEIAAGRKLSDAAKERRQARVISRKTKQYTWEPLDNSVGLAFIISTAIIVLVSLAIVLLMVWWK